MKTSLPEAQVQSILSRLSEINVPFAAHYPGESTGRQPIHTVYGGAQLFKATTIGKLGELAMAGLETYAPDYATFARAVDLPGCAAIPADKAGTDKAWQQFLDAPESLHDESPGIWLACAVYHRVKEKLKREAVEDFRVDFEDGFGIRPDAEEDATAVNAAHEMALGLEKGILSPFIGIRIKCFHEDLKRRGLRTLDLFLTTLLEKTGGQLPDNFVVTLPKVTLAGQVEALVETFDALEPALGLAPNSLKLEVMIETTNALFDHEGRSNLPHILKATKGRCVGAHFGTYDYTASCNITAAYQTMDHAVCDFAKHMMQVTMANTGVCISDGATNVMPVGPHRAPKGESLSTSEQAENVQVVHQAWKLAYDHIRHSLKNGFYQGWDLHPVQLPIRYAACFGFFLEHKEAASERLSNFIDKAAQATLVGDVFDDAATGQGLLNYFLRGLNCGAVTLEEVQATGLTVEEIQGRSFLKILDKRKQA
jgi:citrate lyase beta subunit